MDNNNMKYINTNNLTVIDYGDGEGKLQIYQTTKSPYGYSPRTVSYTHLTLPTNREV